MIILQKNLILFCKKILQASTLLICFNINTDLLASDDAEKTPSGKTSTVFGTLHENLFREPPTATKELSELEKKERQRSFEREKLSESLRLSGISEIFGIGSSFSL